MKPFLASYAQQCHVQGPAAPALADGAVAIAMTAYNSERVL